MLRDVKPLRWPDIPSLLSESGTAPSKRPPPTAPYSKVVGSPYTRRFSGLNGQVRHTVQIPAESLPSISGFGGFGGPLDTVKTFVSAHPFLAIAGAAVAIGLMTGAFEEFKKRDN